MSHRYLFLLSTVINPNDYSIDVSIDSFHEMETPHFGDQVVFDVARKIDPDLGKVDANVHQMMNLRKTFNADRLKGPLMITTDQPIDREDLEIYVQSLDPKCDLSSFVKTASV
jgi:hypothetical protein